MQEIADSLNKAQIPEYLRIGRLVPLQKTFTKGPCNLDDIRPIVVRSHLSKNPFHEWVNSVAFLHIL